MAHTIITKNSSTAGVVPSAGSLTKGELAINVADRRLYSKDNAGNVIEVGGSGTVLKYRDNFTGDGSTVAFTLPRIPLNEELVDIYCDGIYQGKDTFSISGAVITFDEAPLSGASIEVITLQSSPIGETAANYVSYTPAGTGAVATTVQSKLRETVSVKDFMTAAQIADAQAGTLAVDCLSAFQAALASFPNTPGAYPGSYAGELRIPKGSYYLSNTWKIDRQVRIVGDSSPDGNALGSVRLYFADGVDGIVFEDYRTSVSGNFADGSSLESVYITRKNTALSTGDGIWMRTRARLRDVVIDQMGRHGCRIEATSGGAVEGNANLWHIDSCRFMRNGTDGLYIDGADVNAGVAVRLDCSNNGRHGIFDSSFLGNTFVACHTESNTSSQYKTDNSNARSVFLGCYSEGGYPASSIVAPSMVIGGGHGAGLTGNGYFYVDGYQTKTRFYQDSNRTATERYMDLSGSVSLMALYDPNEAGGAWPFRTKGATGGFFVDWANTNVRIMEYTNSQATVANGFPREVYARNPNGGIAFRQGIMVGANMKWRGTGTAAPASGTYVQGDIVWNETPSNAAGQPIGWVCVVAGTPGTWRSFGVTT